MLPWRSFCTRLLYIGSQPVRHLVKQQPHNIHDSVLLHKMSRHKVEINNPTQCKPDKLIETEVSIQLASDSCWTPLEST